MKSHEIREALIRHFKGKGGMGQNDRYLCGEEVRLRSFDSPRIADLIVQDTWTGGFASRDTHLHYPRHGFEIKVSRSDWLNEVKQPDKALAFIPHLHYWSLAIPDEMKFEVSELPDGWGLYTVSNRGVRVKKSPTLNHKAIPMPEGMRISFMRRVASLEQSRADKKVREQMCGKFGHEWSERYEGMKYPPRCRVCHIPEPLLSMATEVIKG